MNDYLSFCVLIAIVVVGYIGFRNQLLSAHYIHRQWRWIKRGLAFVCLIWSVFYVFVSINLLRGADDQNVLATRSWFIRPMLLITLAFIAASGIARRKTNGN